MLKRRTATAVAISAISAASIFGWGGAANAAPQVNQVSASDEVGLTHGELYQALADSPLEKKDEYLNGEAVTTFTAENGVSITLPKPSSGKGLQPGGGKSPGGGHSVKPYLSGKINKKGEPVIYLSQKDQRRIVKYGKITAAGLSAAFGPGGRAAKFVAAALAASIADYFSSNGTCKGNKTLRITGTPGGDAIKEVKCV